VKNRQITGEFTPVPPAIPTKSTGVPSVTDLPEERTHPPAMLTALTGPHRGNTWSLSAENPFMVGREMADLLVQDSVVSRRHARIAFERGRYRLTDLGSTHGTRVNGLSLDPGQPFPLDNGDLVTLAKVAAFRFVAVSVHGYHSVFISYGRADGHFATRLFDHLTVHGVAAFFYPVTAAPGKSIHEVVYDAVLSYDRLAVVCSSRSLTRAGVRTELEYAFARAAAAASFDGIIPLKLDDHVDTAKDPLCARLRNITHIDFSSGIDDEVSFTVGAERLRRALLRA
jgi:hypothetical protein